MVRVAPHRRVLLTLLVASGLLRLLWLDRPPTVIFDESYYVNAARAVAGVEPEGPYANRPLGLDPNTEHPPLAKVIVAGSIRLLGDNPFGWRFPSVLLGVGAILLVYRAADRVAGRPGPALLAAALLAFDNLAFVHGRIFTLEVFQLAFMLLGLDWYVRRRYALAGAGIALAALCKISGALVLPALALYECLVLLRLEPATRAAWRPALRRIGVTGLSFALCFLVLLAMFDRAWVGYGQPFEHLQRITGYGVALRAPRGPSGIQSYPWQWLWNDVQISYFRVDRQIKVGEREIESRPLIWFRGAMNPYVLALLPPGLGFVAWSWWRRRPEARLGALALAWFAANYLPFLGVAIASHRIMYLYYVLPSVPAIALAGGSFLAMPGLPRIVPWLYFGAVLAAFYGYFPFRPLA